MKRIYAEIGFGNGTLFSTEIEDENNEYRIPKFSKPPQIDDYYLRIWILKKVFIFSTAKGFKIKTKDKNKFKFIFGLGGNIN